MPIDFDCDCGKTLRVPDEHAGKRVKCPECNGISFVPGGEEPAFEVVHKNSPPPSAQGYAKSKPSYDEDEEEDGRAYGVTKQTREERRAEERERERRERDRERQRRRERAEAARRAEAASRSNRGGGFFALEAGILNGGTIGGIIAMLIAVLWFVAGLFAGILFYYPPILFIIGLVAFCKGLVNGR